MRISDWSSDVCSSDLLGYESAHHGEGRWNGVAILSRVGLDDVVDGFADDDGPDPEARLITATCGGVRVMSAYVPNGRALDHEHYQYKLRLPERPLGHPDLTPRPPKPVAVVGELPIAPSAPHVPAPTSPP